MHRRAYLITFHPYGLWLRGDPRGWTDRRNAAYGAPRELPSPTLHAVMTQRLTAPAFTLTAPRREVVAEAIAEACAWRAWTLHAMTVQHDHVHTVVSADAAPEDVMGVLKRRATRRLREAGLASSEAKVWARHGSTRYLFEENAVCDECAYVLDAHHWPER